MDDHVRYRRCGGCGHPFAFEAESIKSFVCTVCGVPWATTRPLPCAEHEYKASREDDAPTPTRGGDPALHAVFDVLVRHGLLPEREREGFVTMPREAINGWRLDRACKLYVGPPLHVSAAHYATVEERAAADAATRELTPLGQWP